ncbi:hypothetical protein [Bradyrhizobium cenepequi]
MIDIDTYRECRKRLCCRRFLNSRLFARDVEAMSARLTKSAEKPSRGH